MPTLGGQRVAFVQIRRVHRDSNQGYRRKSTTSYRLSCGEREAGLRHHRFVWMCVRFYAYLSCIHYNLVCKHNVTLKCSCQSETNTKHEQLAKFLQHFNFLNACHYSKSLNQQKRTTCTCSNQIYCVKDNTDTASRQIQTYRLISRSMFILALPTLS